MPLTCKVQYLNDIQPFLDNGCIPKPTRSRLFTFTSAPLAHQIAALHKLLKAPHRLDDAALQLYKDGDYGAYLDLDSSIIEQQEELDSFNSTIVLRTQLSVRVHTIIEKLLKSEGDELMRALHALKNIFQGDKDLVHEFVQNDGLTCLVKISALNVNYQHYTLRALGQVMLYVDGMNGVADHPATLQWLYSLISSKYRHVVKTVLRLLILFVDYSEVHCVLIVKAIKAVHYVQSTKPWTNIIKMMKEYNTADTELLIYAMTLINKTLHGLPDQDSYYDQVDAIEEQGMQSIITKYMGKQGTDLDLLRQFQIYEAVLQHEDGVEKGTPLKLLDETIRNALKNRQNSTPEGTNRRKSRRFSTTDENPFVQISLSNNYISPQQSGDEYKLNDVTPGLRRRRERAERQKIFFREHQAAYRNAKFSDTSSSEDGNTDIHNTAFVNALNENPQGIKLIPSVTSIDGSDSDSEKAKKSSVMSQKISNSLQSPNDEKNQFSDMKGIISKAKEELAKSQSRDTPRSPISSDVSILSRPEIKKSETDLHWDSLKEKSDRTLHLNDLDFTDLASDEEKDFLAAPGPGNGAPPPPPPPIMAPSGPPILNVPPPPAQSVQLMKKKKTLKLFWTEVRDDPIAMSKMSNEQSLWDELSPIEVDTQKLEHLFESRAKDLVSKKQQEMIKNKEIVILDNKRSNAINIGMTKLPPPRTIKTAILKMDATIMNREGIEKLLTMLPTEEERSKIEEAQTANPDLPLGSAEQFLLTLASISELQARLKLWAFKLDYENLEKEIADPLMDLKQGMETLKDNITFKAILRTLLSIGIFLNGSEVKGFQIEYLSKVPEVKDTVHKHTLLHHLCHMVMEKFPDSTDLYSEIGAVTRASKIDFEELELNIAKMEEECKQSFDHLKVISKHDGTTNMKLKVSDFLADCAERIIVLDKVHKRILNRYHKFCLWLGIPLHRVRTTKPNELCRVISEFALEYRTTRERVLQQLEKKANHRERNKTRGKMITEVGKFKSQEDKKDAELKQLLDSNSKNIPTWRRAKKDIIGISPDVQNGSDDEILETLVKTATKSSISRTSPRERKRARIVDRKSLRRTVRLTEEDRQHIAQYIKGY